MVRAILRMDRDRMEQGSFDCGMPSLREDIPSFRMTRLGALIGVTSVCPDLISEVRIKSSGHPLDANVRKYGVNLCSQISL